MASTFFGVALIPLAIIQPKYSTLELMKAHLDCLSQSPCSYKQAKTSSKSVRCSSHDHV